MGRRLPAAGARQPCDPGAYHLFARAPRQWPVFVLPLVAEDPLLLPAVELTPPALPEFVGPLAESPVLLVPPLPLEVLPLELLPAFVPPPVPPDPGPFGGAPGPSPPA